MSQEHGIKSSYMDRTADPGRDFFRFANGAWLDATAIPPEYPRWGSFLILRESNLAQLNRLMEELSASTGNAPGTVAQQVGDFFFSGMDEKKVARDGAKPLAREFARIDAVRSRRQLAEVIGRLHNYGANVLFGFGSGQDFADSNQVIAQAAQSGLGLPDRDYYTKDDGDSVTLREKYVAHVARMFILLGYNKSRAEKAAAAVMKIETALAHASLTKTERRDPAKNYHKMPLAEFQEIVSRLPLDIYLKTIGSPEFDQLNVGQPAFFKGVNELLGTITFTEWKAYLRWHFIRTTASYLSPAFVDEKFDFYGKTLTGQKEQQARWKTVVDVTGSLLSEAVGQLYVARHFPPSSKTRMLELVENLREAFRQTLETIDWMSDDTRKAALEKLNAFNFKIGYPDKWIDYSSLRVHRNCYVWNVLRAKQFASKRDLAEIGKTVDRGQWHMPPHMVNAYYSSTLNENVFPAGILQPPFFDAEADDAYNYGGIGMVIGHEMTHGFDDKGSKFDARGNLKNWWTEADRTEFERRIALIKEQYGSFEVAGGVRLIGDLISGEAAADLGGAKLAYLALQKALEKTGRKTDAYGFTDEQRFFLAFAQLWATKALDEYEKLSAKTDPHPPGRYRVKGTLAHMTEFVQAFGLADDCEMMLPPDKRCKLW